MLTDQQKEQLRDRVYDLLWEVGLEVDHEKMTGDLLKMGCERAPSGRIRMPRAVVEKFADYQKKTQAEDIEKEKLINHYGIVDYGQFLFWTDGWKAELERLKKGVRTSVFDCGPTKYYDYPSGRSLPVDTAALETAMKWAEAVPEVGLTSVWYRQDAPPQMERIDSLVRALKLTTKAGAIEAIYPEVIKYHQEISAVVTGKQDAAYLAGSQCLTPPLIMEYRSAEDTAERARLGIHKYHIATMCTIGLHTPVTLSGSMVVMAAEILGGMVCAYSQDPVGDITGRMLASVMDMKTAQVTYATPECAIVNQGVKDVFDAFWGGHIRVDQFFITFARKPGLQAVAETYAGGRRVAMLMGLPEAKYAGVGTLDNGATGSFTQAVLDIEIRKSEFIPPVVVDDDTLAFEEIKERTEKHTTWFDSDHTLTHFRELWNSSLFRTADPEAGSWAGDEKAILDKCDEIWREQVKSYTPPNHLSDDQIRDLDAIVVKAKKEFLGI